jgi:hypothetical protein
MIVSHKYKFIFLKTNKTAGTSIEIALSKYCDTEDIIPKLIPVDEAMRNELGYRSSQNYLVPFKHYDTKQWLRLIRKRKRICYTSHMLARDVKRLLPQDAWNDYFKFAVERNPWDRAISLYYWKYPEEPRISFSEFLRSDEINRLKRKGSGLYSIDDKIVVDKVYKYEELSSALEDLTTRVGLPEVPQLPRAKGQTRKNRAPYRESYSDEEADIIAQAFREEIDRLGYQF